jgi:glyoxylase-like metal-dependent hydrolase (beta-lactamase superfamily II)
MSRNPVLLRYIAVASALALAPAGAAAQSAEALLKRSAHAMGATDLKTLRYVAEGNGYTYGQAYVPGMPWPEITVHSQIRTINYDTGSMREEITLSRAEAKGGGGYPLSGQQRNDQFVSGSYAWNVAGGNPVAGPRFVTDRTHQLWITPHGVLKAAMKNNAAIDFQDKDGKSLAAVSFTQPGAFAATAYIGGDYLVERVESRVPDPVLGEVAVVTSFSEYRDFGGVKFPGRVRQYQAGSPVLDVAVKEVQPNAAADIALPDAVKNATERVTTDKVADGVWFIAGGSHNSVAIEMKDHLVLVEAPLNEGRMTPVLEAVKKLAPGKPIRFVVNSHNHFDHSGGLRTAAAYGATIVTQANNRPYFEKAFAVSSKIRPDPLARSGKKARFLEVKDKHAMSDGTRTLEILRIAGSVHNDTFLMVYLPKEKLLVEADAYTPLPPNTPPPATPNANNVNLIANIERMKLSVGRILPLHGRVVPVSELYTTAKATPK